MKAPQIKADTQSEQTPRSGESSAPWLVPGPEKELWKQEGHRYDLRDLDASRPSDLRITFSPPRQFVSA
jgi:hypothetical protein